SPGLCPLRARSLHRRRRTPGRARGVPSVGWGGGSRPPADDDPLLWRERGRGILEQANPNSRFLLSWVEAPDDIIHHRGDEEYLRNALLGMRAPDQTWSVEHRLKEILTGKIPWLEALRYYFNKYIALTTESWLN